MASGVTLSLLPLLLALATATQERVTAPDFNPLKSVWSRASADEVPADLVEPSAEELAATLGLVPGEADDMGVARWRHPASGMDFVFVPGGWFLMGSNHSDLVGDPLVVRSIQSAGENSDYPYWEQPQRRIYVSSFFIGYTEVTVAQYRRFLEAAAAGEVAPYEFPWPAPVDHTPFLWMREGAPFFADDQPAVGMNWLSAYAFCRWLGGRLPTEAEWEKAARGTDGRRYPWGNTLDVTRVNVRESANFRTVPVGTYPGGRSPYGARNMGGNVQEWVMDAFEGRVYVHYPVKDPCLIWRVPATEWRAIRGGTWGESNGEHHRARTTSRSRLRTFPRVYETETRTPPLDFLFYGLRVVLSPTVDLLPEGWPERKAPEDAGGTPSPVPDHDH